MKANAMFILFFLLLTGCSLVTSQAADPTASLTPTIEPTMSTLPNPASVYCEQQGYTSEIRTASDGSQSGVCIFPDGSECDEWAYYHGECSPASQGGSMPNPASVYCQQQGYTLEIRTAADGSQTGVCVFPDGSECDEWAYYRAECKPPSSATSTETSDYGSQGWKIYRDEALGYSFHYPADPLISIDDEPKKSLSISGPGMGSEFWGIAHPSDREEYRPPENADLLQWLTDHYLLGENRMPDEQIAGTTAIHFRHERSPQSYAFDQYFFAHAGQLYQISIGHSAETEDWELNNRFLQSFQFDQPAVAVAEPTPIPTAVPIDPGFYQGFWTYTHPVYGFSIMLPEDWVVEGTTTGDPVMNDHTLILHQQPTPDVYPTIRMSFRTLGEDVLIWPTGVGQGEFVSQGTLDVAGEPASRNYFVCPNGIIDSIWYQGGVNSANIQRGNMEFGFIYSYSGPYCQEPYSLTGKVQLVGELIIASLQVP
jgi:putative hemolysin